MAIDLTNDPSVQSWVNVPDNSSFPIQNLPFGIFSTSSRDRRAGIAIGNQILDLVEVAKLGHFSFIKEAEVLFSHEVLNPYISLGKEVHKKVRSIVFELLKEGNTSLEGKNVLVAQNEASLHLPVQIGDYTDFYSSEEHAVNVGTMFRGKDNALMPNWKHLPVGYHGRSSSIVVSGTPIIRPNGQKMPPGAETPVFGKSNRMDIELEMGFVVGKSTALGESVPVDKAEEYIFGLMLFNDWSARDIQKWEYVPLGPFLGKNFGSTVSPWIVTLDALEPFRTKGPDQSPMPLPYLQSDKPSTFDIQLEVHLKTESGNEAKIATSNFKYLYWSMAQQLAHQTVNGCNLNVGDLCASGTISGPTKDSFGSLLELTWNGKEPLQIGEETRTFLEDNDTITLKGFCDNGELRIGFGEAVGKILK
ncbi:fumarylacetoacetase [Flammeovirga sp. EKP202]|uniref:fumarylacetoacetase n=1 Tax=Flammeovirga sp. EKP202 TaxID=2770592 RepID=UPI00165EC862|nr:fumarylacetoacetase [Flammeovirga sp. EKP202]MBD0403348.1 fumarylacetoacetase [Flammeovirga sp. EKP202]